MLKRLWNHMLKTLFLYAFFFWCSKWNYEQKKPSQLSLKYCCRINCLKYCCLRTFGWDDEVTIWMFAKALLAVYYRLLKIRKRETWSVVDRNLPACCDSSTLFDRVGEKSRKMGNDDLMSLILWAGWFIIFWIIKLTHYAIFISSIENAKWTVCVHRL